jgi:lipase
VPAAGYDTDTCADDLSTLLDLLGFTGSRSPVVVGHRWGGNIAMSLAARRDGVAALCCLDGGWIRPAWQYGSFEECWAAAEAHRPRGNGEADQRRRSIARSIFFGDPRAWYPLVRVPVALCPVVPPDGRPDPAGRGTAARTGVAEAVSRLPRARVSWYYGEDDAIGTDPGKLVDDLLMLAAEAEPQAN